MELPQDSSKLRALSTTISRTLSSSSSAFVSASQSPFFSPRSPSFRGSESIRSDIPYSSNTSILSADTLSSNTAIQKPEPLSSVGVDLDNILPTVGVCDEGDFQKSSLHDHGSTSVAICNSNSSSYIQVDGIVHSRNKEKQKKWGRNHGRFSFTQSSASLSSNRQRSFDVYIGLHGHNPSLLRFAKWLRAELEMQGISCFSADRARCKSSRSSSTVERAMNTSTFGVVILSRKSFGNRYSIMEIRNFLGKKNLVPIFFDLGPGDCLARDIIERRGEMWEKHGGELWMLYDGSEMEWKEAVNGLSRVDEWKLEAQDGNWRDCILKAVVLLATRLGRRSVVERVNIWKERAEREEFPFPRNENFIGRKKELSELELILFGDFSGDAEREYFELKTRHRRKNLVISRFENSKIEEKVLDRQKVSSSGKGKEPVTWKESEKEIEMQSVESPQIQTKNGGKHRRRRRPIKIVIGKGVACVSGDSGIGKTELLLEFAYRFSQRYKMVLWIGGETRYIRQNYLNLSPFLDVDVGIENRWLEKRKTKSFEEQEAAAIYKVRKELMRDIPFLVVIDNLESEKDWWDQKTVMDLLPRFGGETHIIISTRLSRIMNLEPLKLSYLSGVEAMSLMKGIKEYPITEIDALKVIEEKLGRLTLGLGIVGAILSELPINPTRLLDTVNRMPLRDLKLSRREGSTLSQQAFLIQLLEVCFSIFDHADGPSSLATRMVQVCGFFGPSSIPVSLLALAANKIPEKHQNAHLWKKCLYALTCGFTGSHTKRSESEASSMLVRFGIARSSSNEDCIHFHEIIKLYAQKREVPGVTQATVEAISNRGFIAQDLEHLWAACFLLFGFGTNQVVVQLKISELLFFVKRVVLPLAIRTFMTFSRCNAALELLRLCTDALEAAEESLVSRVEKWLDKPLCWRSVQTSAQLNPLLWQELALMRATILETRAKLMLKGGQYDLGDDLIRKVLFIRTSICGEDHPDTISTRETLSKLMRHMTSNEVS
ncbi:hypothetical protein BVC80_1787g57 [Macleaya cordata]|uniref:TIR domain-containing protein n=1 Tax=Macleaya cordata TaxID=56857 RepID=A0A200QU63_MACCD|nr:hypothetical protein BVC80_1787g57 [Macleaya cordata]